MKGTFEQADLFGTPTLITYYVVIKGKVTEAPDSNNGYGDYPNFAYTRLGPVEAANPQSARSKFKKVLPALRFSARFSPWLIPAEDLGSFADTPIDHAWTLFSRFHTTTKLKGAT